MKNPWSRKGLFYRAWQTTQLYRDDNKNEFFASLTNVGILGMSSGGLCFHCSNGFGVRWETCLWAKTFWISQSCNAGQVNSEREMRTIQSELLIHILSNLWMASPSADDKHDLQSTPTGSSDSWSIKGSDIFFVICYWHPIGLPIGWIKRNETLQNWWLARFRGSRHSWSQTAWDFFGLPPRVSVFRRVVFGIPLSKKPVFFELLFVVKNPPLQKCLQPADLWPLPSQLIGCGQL